MKTFYQVLANTLITAVVNNFVWFSLTFWAYLETRSVLVTGFIGGIYLVATALSGIWFGSIVDHNKKKTAMLASSVVTLIFFILGFIIYSIAPVQELATVTSPWLWAFAVVLLLGVIAGNIRNIAVPTLVTLLVDEDKRDKANGLSGSMFGVSFAITSVASGLVLGFSGMSMVLWLALGFSVLALVHLLFVNIPEKRIEHLENQPKKVDLKGTFLAIKAVPGLIGLILFSTFNNFLGGVYMALMDAYGLSLVSVQVWGLIWGILSCGFIVGGLIIAKKGLGRNPLKTLLLVNIIMWSVSAVFTIQPWLWLLLLGMTIWICLVPFAEASEQTIIQKVVPQERQGRVFGFATSVEQAASPLTAFLIGPITQLVFIPFMTTGKGVDLIGGWYGTGDGRGIALVFTITGVIGLVITILAFKTQAYRLLSKRYLQK